VVAPLSPTWQSYFRNKDSKYQIIAAPGMEAMALRIVEQHPGRFLYHETQWGKFPDGTDNIMLGGFQPVNHIAGEHVLMLATFTNNSTTLTQLTVMVTLLQSFVESLTVVLPFYPVGTMTTVIKEGQVATANTYAQMFSNLPSCGRPTRLVIYDLHTLQNRFYLHGNAIASLQTSVPLLLDRLSRLSPAAPRITCVAFPDDGAAKRFGYMFKNLQVEVVTCGRSRNGEPRVSIQDGEPRGRVCVVIDDLAQTGSTLYQCGMALKAAGATSVSAFVVHAVFPNDSWRPFLRGGARDCFDRFYVTNSIPSVTDALPPGDVFEVLDLSAKIVEDLDKFS